MERKRRAGIEAGVLAGVIGALVMVVVGLLTFGVQATVRPSGVPLAVAVPDGPAGAAVMPVVQRIADRGGDATSWTVTTADDAATALRVGAVFGYLSLAPAPDGGLAVSATTSGALHPSATQVAEEVLRDAAAAVQDTPPAHTAVTVMDPVSPGGQVLPLAATALLWIGGTAAGGVHLARSRGTGWSRSSAISVVLTFTLLGPAVVLGFATLWDGGTAWPPAAIGFLVLVAAGFAAVQGAVLRLAGLLGLPILGLLYLMAAPMATQPPELITPVHRVLLWSWTPFRFAVESQRSLLYAPAPSADITTSCVIFGAFLVAGLTVILWPKGRRPQGRSAPAAKILSEA
jgi:hypothetical protein